MPLSNLGHEQIQLIHPQWSDLKPFIDVEIAPLIMTCWKLGIWTQQSCWNNTERQESWIQFRSIPDALKFLGFVIEVAKSMRLSTDRTILRPSVWFPHFEIPTLVTCLNHRLLVPM